MMVRRVRSLGTIALSHPSLEGLDGALRVFPARQSTRAWKEGKERLHVGGEAFGAVGNIDVRTAGGNPNPDKVAKKGTYLIRRGYVLFSAAWFLVHIYLLFTRSVVGARIGELECLLDAAELY